MRKILRSRNTDPITSLIAAALSPSLPIGFSTMMRERGLDESLGAKTLRQRAEQVWTGCKVISANPFVGTEQRLQVRPPLIARRVHGDKVETGEESLRRRARFVVDGFEFRQRVKDRGAKRVAVEVTP